MIASGPPLEILRRQASRTTFSPLEAVGLSRQPPRPQADTCRRVSSPSGGTTLPTKREVVLVPENRGVSELRS
jgi:hypothetical protein